MSPGVPSVLRDAVYKVSGPQPKLHGRCPWCKETADHPRVLARAFVAGVLLPVDEQLVVCWSCQKVSAVPTLFGRLLQSLTTALLTLFMGVPFGGALYFAGAIVIGCLQGIWPDLLTAGVIIAGLVVTTIGVSIPLRRLVEALRGGLARVEVPLEYPTAMTP